MLMFISVDPSVGCGFDGVLGGWFGIGSCSVVKVQMGLGVDVCPSLAMICQ